MKMEKNELNLVEQVMRAAQIEQGFKKDKKLKTKKEREEMREVAEKVFIFSDTSRYLVSLLDKPIYLNDFKSFDPNIRATHANYKIRYLPKNGNDYHGNTNFRFQIMQDLIHSSVYVCNYEHWLIRCKHIPELDWLRRNSTLSKGLFSIALSHPGLCIPFTIDFLNYDKKIREQARLENREKDLDDKPFVNFACSKEFAEEHKDMKIVEATPKCDIINKIKEADAEYESTSEND